MALKKKLDDGWYLSDGILNPFPVGEATDVMSAAVKAGYAPDPLKGLNLMKGEWIYNRAWTYSTVFETPPEEDERVFLFFERLTGQGEVFVNGRRAGSFGSGEARVDVTALIACEHNELRLRFQAPGLLLPAENPMPLLGLAGPAWIITGNFVTLERVVSRTDGRMMTVEHDITAHTAGKYTFTYTVSQDGLLINRESYTEQLPAARVIRTHTVSLAGEDAGSAPCCDVRVVVERSGIGCAQVSFRAPLPGRGAGRRAVLLYKPPTQETMKAVAALGADAVCVSGGEKSIVDADCLFDMKRLPAVSAHFADAACVAPRTLADEARDEPFWPPRTPLWRLRGGVRPDVEALSALYGPDAAQNGDTAALLTRYEQAAALLRYALCARQCGETAVVPWCAPWESLCGEGVTERGGRPRMAYWTLKAAWMPDIAWPELPDRAAERGAAIRIPIWAASDRAGGEEVSVDVSVYRMDGSRVAHSTKTARLDVPRCVDTIELDAPDGGALIVRCAVLSENVELLSQLDMPLPIRDGGAPMQALLASSVKLHRTPGGVFNGGGMAALAVGRCLLPGESVSDGEWLNEEF